jgi:WD40 repeat protein
VTIRRTGGVIYDCVAPGVADVWAGRADGVVCRHPAAGGDPDRMVAAFTAGVAGITRSADGTRVLAGSAAGGVKVLDAETGRVDLDLPAAHRDAVQGLAFLPGGWFATGSRDRTVKVWDAAGRLVLLLPQTRPVRRLFPSADGTALTVLAEGERGLRRWDMTALKAGLADLGIDPALP